MGPMRWGASFAVRKMDVGPSGPPMMAMEAASLGKNPRARALNRVKKIPICAAAPRSISLGRARRDEKSIMAPRPRKTMEGYRPVVTPKYR